MIKLHN